MKTRTSTLLAIIAIPVVIIFGFLSPNGIPVRTKTCSFGWTGDNYIGYYEIIYGEEPLLDKRKVISIEEAELNKSKTTSAKGTPNLGAKIKYPLGKIFIATIRECHLGKCQQAGDYVIVGLEDVPHEIIISRGKTHLMAEIKGPDKKTYFLIKFMSKLPEIWKDDSLFDKDGNFKKEFSDKIPENWDMIFIDGEEVQ